MSFLLNMFSRKSTTNNTMNPKISEESPSRKPRKSRTPTKLLNKLAESPINVKNIPLLVPKEEMPSVEREPTPQISKREQAKKTPPPFKMPMDMTTYLKKLTENKLDAPKKGCLKKMGNYSFAADISQSSMTASPLRSFISEPSPKTLVKKWDDQKQLNVEKARAELLAVVSKDTEPAKERLRRAITPIKYTHESFDEQIKQAVNRINRRSRTQPPKTPKTPASAKKRTLDDGVSKIESDIQFESVKHIPHVAKKINTIPQILPKTPAPKTPAFPKAKENNEVFKTFPKTSAVKKMRMVPLKGFDEPETKQTEKERSSSIESNLGNRMNLSMPVQTPAPKRKYDLRLNKSIATDEPSKKKIRENSMERRVQPPRLAKSNVLQRFTVFYLADVANKKMNRTIDRSFRKTPIKPKESTGKTPKSRKTVQEISKLLNLQTIKKNEGKAKKNEKVNTRTRKPNDQKTTEKTKRCGKNVIKEAIKHRVPAKKTTVKDQGKEKINDENKNEMPKKRAKPARSVSSKHKVTKEVIVNKKDEKKPIAKTAAKESKRKIFGDVKNTLKKETVTRFGQSEATKEQIIDLNAEKTKNNLHNSSFASLL